MSSASVISCLTLNSKLQPFAIRCDGECGKRVTVVAAKYTDTNSATHQAARVHYGPCFGNVKRAAFATPPNPTQHAYNGRMAQRQIPRCAAAIAEGLAPAGVGANLKPVNNSVMTKSSTPTAAQVSTTSGKEYFDTC